MICYRCIVTPNNICIFVLSSLRVASDQIFMILISSMKYTFIYDFYGNVSFFILFTHQKFAYNLKFIP